MTPNLLSFQASHQINGKLEYQVISSSVSSFHGLPDQAR